MSEARSKASKAANELAAVAFRQFSPELDRYLMRRIHGGFDVANLAMEIYERFLRAQNIEAVENPRAFLFRIARNAIVDTLRLEATRPVVFDSEALSDAGDNLDLSVPDSGDHIDTVKELQSVRKAMNRLPPMHQAVLWLAVHDGLSHAEVAQRTGLTVKTVGVYLSDARARLRTLLEHR